MILVETEVGELAARSRSLQVLHRAAGLPRGLEVGEVVVVRCGALHRTGCVVEVDFTLDDTVYRLALGGRITAGQAHQLLAPREPGPAGRGVDVTDVLALLGSLRDLGEDELVHVPEQRGAEPRLVAGA